MSQHSAYSHAAMRQNSACHYSNLFLIMENLRTSAFNLIETYLFILDDQIVQSIGLLVAVQNVENKILSSLVFRWK